MQKKKVITNETTNNHVKAEIHSRRRSLKWIGEITAGASLALLGLHTSDHLKALAMNIPDCTVCGCRVANCVEDTYTCPKIGFHILVTYYPAQCFPCSTYTLQACNCNCSCQFPGGC